MRLPNNKAHVKNKRLQLSVSWVTEAALSGLQCEAFNFMFKLVFTLIHVPDH